MLAAVVEGVFDAQLDEIAHSAGHRDAAGLGNGLDAGRQIDAVAEDILVLVVDDHLAEMHTDPEQHALVLVQLLVEARHALLNVDGSGHG